MQSFDVIRVNNLAQFLGPIEIGSPQVSDSILKFYNSSSIYGTFFQAGNATSQITYTLPVGPPASNNSVLQSTTVGVLSWSNAPSLDVLNVLSGPSYFGPGPLTVLTLAATTGVTWAAATYYYNVYPVDANGVVGGGQKYTSVVVGGANNAVNINWNAVPGAASYRVGRGATPDGYNGYYTVTGATTYKDTNLSFTGATNPYPPLNTISNSIWLRVNGWTVYPASSGGIAFTNFETGVLDGFIAQTSAGEMEYLPGSSGAAYGDHVFEDHAGIELIKLHRSTRGDSSSAVEVVASNNAGGGSADFNVTYGTNFKLRPGNSDAWTFTSATSKGPAGSNTAPAYAFSSGAGYGMWLGGGGTQTNIVANGSSGAALFLLSNGDTLTTQLGPLATNATAGFMSIVTCNGTPTGTPTVYTGQKPWIYDTSANKIWFYNGSWRGVAVV